MAIFIGGIAVAHYLAGRYVEALRYAEEQLRLRPGFHGGQRLRCASLAQSGRIDEAREFLELVRKRAASIVDRLDQDQRSLPNAGSDGAIPGRHAKGGFDLIESPHLGWLPAS